MNGRSKEFISVLVLSFLLLASGCGIMEQQADNSQLPAVPVRNLLIDNAAFPTDWVVTGTDCVRDCKSGEGDLFDRRTFGREAMTGHVDQEIYRLATTSRAQAKFETNRRNAFQKSHILPSTDYIPPPQVAYRSP